MTLLIFGSQTMQAKEVPKLNGRVNDHANLFTDEEEQKLARKLIGHEKATSNQIAILTVQSLEGDTIEDFSIRVASAWKLGSEKNDNGLLITIAKDEKDLRIEVGYGLEQNLTDLIAGRIIKMIMEPHFKEGKFFEGTNSALDAIILTLNGNADQVTQELSNKETSQVSNSKWTTFLVIAAVILIICAILSSITHEVVGGIVGAVGFALTDSMIFADTVMLILVFGIIGFLLGAMSSLIIRIFAEVGLPFGGGGGDSGFSGGGGGFGGGGASGGWDD